MIPKIMHLVVLRKTLTFNPYHYLILVLLLLHHHHHHIPPLLKIVGSSNAILKRINPPISKWENSKRHRKGEIFKMRRETLTISAHALRQYRYHFLLKMASLKMISKRVNHLALKLENLLNY